MTLFIFVARGAGADVRRLAAGDPTGSGRRILFIVVARGVSADVQLLGAGASLDRRTRKDSLTLGLVRSKSLFFTQRLGDLLEHVLALVGPEITCLGLVVPRLQPRFCMEGTENESENLGNSRVMEPVLATVFRDVKIRQAHRVVDDRRIVRDVQEDEHLPMHTYPYWMPLSTMEEKSWVTTAAASHLDANSTPSPSLLITSRSG